MTAPKVDFIALLGVLEVAVILLVVALVFVLRSRRLAERLRALQVELTDAITAPEHIEYEQYLRDEIIRNQELIEQAAAAEDESEREAAVLLSLRRQFLELELSAREAENNPVELRKHFSSGMHDLRESLRPEPEVITEQQTVVEEHAADQPPDAAESAPEREHHETHDEELDHLRQVINNQQDAMARLRAKLSESGDEISDLDSILAKLDEFERQSRELHQCLEVLEAENQRLKDEKQKGSSPGVILQSGNTAQLSNLKSMVDKQQATISGLHGLIKELAPNAKKAQELEAALTSIQRTNDELTGCVAVLEDENAMLRSELEEIQAYLEKQEQESLEAADDGETDTPPAMSDREAEIKIKELEALLEFKDAAIEELEKQFNKLQAKYLAETGKSASD